MKIYVAYNTCEIGGQGNIVYYVDAIRSLLAQRNVELKIVISACMPSHHWLIQSENTFGKYVSYNFIYENVPVSVSFNHSIDKMIEQFGPADAYMYVDSGISFWDPGMRYDSLSKMCEVHQSGPYAITAAMPSNDDGRQWWGINYVPNEDYIFPVGKTTNMHCQIFSEDWRLAYGRILPDIFASHCMESVFSHMCGAIRRQFIITQKVHLLHNHSMDGASIGSRTQDPDRTTISKTFETGGLFWKYPYDMNSIYREGYHLGFGFEECKIYWPHDPACYDENGFCKNDELRGFIKEKLFHKDDKYTSIKHAFLGGQ